MKIEGELIRSLWNPSLTSSLRTSCRTKESFSEQELRQRHRKSKGKQYSYSNNQEKNNTADSNNTTLIGDRITELYGGVLQITETSQNIFPEINL